MKFWAVIWQRWYVEMKYFEEMFFVWVSFNSLELKYLVILTSCSFSATRLICCRNWVFSRIRFWATFTNLVFLPFSVSIKLSSLTLENGKRFLLMTMQYHSDLSCFSYSWVCLFILLHLRCTQISPLSHWIESELLATGWQHILHG